VLTRLPSNGGVIQLTFVSYFVAAETFEWKLAADAEWERLGLPPVPYEWPGTSQPGAESPVPVNLPVDPAAEPAFRAWLAANPKPSATIAQVAAHVEHAREVAGVDHIGIGGDYDGTPEVAAGLDDVSGYPRLLDELRGRGWSETELGKLANGNVLRALGQADEHATDPQHPRC
jgi:membrane dipeptidase